MKTTKRLISVGSVLLASTMLGACSADLDEVQGWMDQTRANTPRRVGKLEEPKNFVPFRYEGLAPDRNRRREVLENFPLDTVRLVGHMQNKTNGNVALLSVDNVVYQARVGNYVGQNYGRIVKITETEMGIKELVRDATGDWVEQDTTLALEDEPKP